MANEGEIGMMEVQVRPARSEDIPEMADLFILSVSDLYARSGLSVAAPPRVGVLLEYEHVLATGTFYVAEAETRIVAIAGAIVRDHIWFLSAFWAHPDYQRRHIGMPLLRRVWRAGQEQGATTFFTWSSVDHTAMAAYMKLGMWPGYPILQFSGTPRQLPPAPAGYTAVELEKRVAVELDQEVRGTGRQVDHDFWSWLPPVRARQVSRNEEVIGYYYFHGGYIGPVAWAHPGDAEAVMTLAWREAQSPHRGTQAAPREIHVAVPGINQRAVKFALDSGLRLMHYAHFMSTGEFGRMAQYLPSGATFY